MFLANIEDKYVTLDSRSSHVKLAYSSPYEESQDVNILSKWNQVTYIRLSNKQNAPFSMITSKQLPKWTNSRILKNSLRTSFKYNVLLGIST